MKTLGLYISSFWAPLKSARRLKSDPPRESTLIAWAFLATILSFLARLPNVITLAETTPEPTAFIGAQFATSLIFGPLFMYFMAFLSHVIAKLLGGRGTGEGARVALFWSVLLMQPLVFLNEIIRFSASVTTLQTVISLAFAILFLTVWLSVLIIFEKSST